MEGEGNNATRCNASGPPEPDLEDPTEADMALEENQVRSYEEERELLKDDKLDID